jgi:sugar phosphate isomerase/epimerase
MEHTIELTGFADEAAPGLDGQIRATRELGWRCVEARAIDGTNIHDLSEEAFEIVCARLAEAGIRINCFGSAIANWGKKITDPFEITLAEALRAIPRMRQLGTRLIRIMSYAVIEGREPEDQMAEERFGRLRELVRLFADAGITAVHENCMNYGGIGWPYTLRLLENVPGLKLVFDTGNPVFNDDRSQPRPYPKQSAWEFYAHVRPFIEHVHIKDCIFDPATAATQYTWPGEGHGDVRKILKDLLEDGYRGAISIEPHLQVVFHDASVRAPEEAMFNSYVEYGRRLETLIAEIQAELAQEKRK